VVVAIPVCPGDDVQAGDVVAVTESMKMESSLTAPVNGRVREVLVSPNTHVANGRPLLRIDPGERGGRAGEGERLRFELGEIGLDRGPTLLERLEWLVLGYDVPPDEAEQILDRLRSLPADPAGERHLLEVYADLRALSRPHPGEGGHAAEGLASPEQHLHAFLRSLDTAEEGLPERFVSSLERALAHYGVPTLERTAALEAACYRLFVSRQRAQTAGAAIRVVLRRHLEHSCGPADSADSELREVLDRLEAALAPSEPEVAELAREVRWRCCDRPLIQRAREDVYAVVDEHLVALAAAPEQRERDAHVRALVECPQPLLPLMFRRVDHDPGAAVRHALLEALTRRYYRGRTLEAIEDRVVHDAPLLLTSFDHGGARQHVAATLAEPPDVPVILGVVNADAGAAAEAKPVMADVYMRRAGLPADPDEITPVLQDLVAQAQHLPSLARVTFILGAPDSEPDQVDVITFSRGRHGTLVEDRDIRGLHPTTAERMDLWRLTNFALERIPSDPDVHLFRAVAHTNQRDERLVAVAEVRDLAPVRDERGRIVALPELERIARQCFEAMRTAQLRRPSRERLHWNRVMLYAWPLIEFDPEEARPVIARLARMSAGLGLEMVLLRARMGNGSGDPGREVVLRYFNPAGRGVVMQVDPLPREPLQPLDEGAQRIVSARRRGFVHPAEILKVLAPGPGASGAAIPAGEFTEHDLNARGDLMATSRPGATNSAGVIVGLVRNWTERYPEGMERVVILGDPTRSLGSLAEPECRRIVAALDLAERRQIPCEWFALSAGAKIAIDSGTENMDWVAAVLRRIVQFTQAGGEINVVVSGINVGAQPYWNAEATMLMHTKGVLIMTPESAMVLTGKQALDYSGGVSAEDNIGIGGHERIMGPNGQAQYWAPDIAGACQTLLTYYEHTYVARGERFPRRAETVDPSDRDVGPSPHWAPGSDLQTVGGIFSEAANPGRKKPFDIRSVMRAVIDSDHPPLERWKGMAEAEAAVTWDAHIGGWPVAMLGIESRPLSRHGPVPADGPEQWTSGTLFPLASKKIARSINAASGRRPLVVLANLAGFDGSPESMRRLQLEYGAEIGRAVVNFDGPIAFCVISRFHGGAFVVFSRALNENLESSAIEGSYASVIGGAPAAAVVFSREVDHRTGADARVAELDERIAHAKSGDRQELGSERAARWAEVRAEKLGQFATEFDAIHSIERAVEVGSVERIIPPSEFRPYLIDAVERGMRRTLERLVTGNGHARVGGAVPVTSVG
jgi:acetyl-CoA carboxylase carboxyltransferase component/pyruvate/2-oxoglutarate dehydrogenase complex dihydrolipoamide acyltransferase (E2) component